MQNTIFSLTGRPLEDNNYIYMQLQAYGLLVNGLTDSMRIAHKMLVQ